MKRLKALLISISLLIASQAHAGVPVVDGARVSTDALEYIETATRYKAQFDKWMEEATRWQTQYENLISGNFDSMLSALGIGSGTLNRDANRIAYQKFIDDYQKDNRCDRMSSKQQVAKSLCSTRRNIEVGRFKIMAEMLDYTDQKNAEIKNALKEASNKRGTEEKKLALAQVNALQNSLKDKVAEYTSRMKGYEDQINILKVQQGEVARTVMQGKPPGLIGAAASAAIMAGVFDKFKH